MVVTDSGLGGLIVAADIFERLKMNGAFARARVVYFNCRPSETFGFDKMESQSRRHRVFNNVLACATERFAPDAIVIACNTLSVLYAKTAYAARPAAMVFGIVEMGVDLLAGALRNHPEDQAVLCASPTTVQSGEHHRLLANRGFPDERFFYQNCPGAPDAIEHEPWGGGTRSMIEQFMRAAANRRRNPEGKLILSLNCTHFAYVSDLFEDGLRKAGVKVVETLDPTVQMAERFMAGVHTGRFAKTDATIEVVSQARVDNTQKQSIGALIASRSAQTAEALWNDRCQVGMFDFGDSSLADLSAPIAPRVSGRLQNSCRL